MAEGGHESPEDLIEAQVAVVSVRYAWGTSLPVEFSQDSKGSVLAECGNDDAGDVIGKTITGSRDKIDELDPGDCLEDIDKVECDVHDEEDDDIDGGCNEDVIGLITCMKDEERKLKSDNAERAKKRKTKKKHRIERRSQNQFISFIEIHSGTSPQVEQVEVNRPCPIPTLVELCLRKGIQQAVVSDMAQPGQIAPGIRALLKVHYSQYKLEQVQLKWLLEALKHAEVYVKHRTLQFMNTHGKKLELFVRECRSLCTWDGDVRVDAWELHNETKSNACMVIFAAGYDYADWPVVALAHCVNILLPPYLSEDGTSELKTSIIRVKRFLNKHSTTLVTHCFNTALAYVWWCRGKIEKAKKALLDISENMPSGNEVRLKPEPKKIFRSRTLLDEQKALCHNEVGRMLSQFDDPDAAIKFFRHAVEVIKEGSSVACDRLVLQSCVLSAAAYDQGQMDQSHASKAAAFWDRVTDDPTCDEGLLQAAVESFMRCHAGFSVCETNTSLHNEGDYKSWLWETNSRIKKVAGRGPQLYLHQSLVLAVLGENKLAEKAYQDYVEQYVRKTDIFIYQDAGPMPGSLACAASSMTKYHPWWLLLEWMATKADLAGSCIPKPIQMLPLIWRRILRQESYRDATEPNVFEVQGKQLNLHLTHDGYLTGAFMHNLPPWKTVLLNPYTGSICVPHQHRQHELQEWDKKEFCPPCSDFSLNYCIPVPILLYHDAEDDSVVTLMNVTSNANFRQELITMNVGGGMCPRIANTASTLIYSKNRVTVKVNLLQLVLEARRKNILQQVKDLTPSVDKNVVQDVVDVLDFCCRRGLQINFALAREIIDGRKKDFMESVKQQRVVKGDGGTVKVKDGQETKSKTGNTPLHQALQLQKILYVGVSTIVLCLYTGANPPEAEHDCPLNQDTLVFLDCSSPEAFRNPVIHCPDLPHLEWVLPEQDNCWTSKSCRQNVIFFYANSEALVIFDEHGSIIHKEKIHRCRYKYRACSGWSLLGCESGPRHGLASLRVLDAKSLQKFSEPPKEFDDFIVEQTMVFVSRLSGVLVLNPVSLKPLVVKKPTKGGVTEEVRSDGVLIHGEGRSLRILATNNFFKPSLQNCNQRIAYTRVILGVANHLLILERRRSVNNSPGDASFPIEVVVDIMIPGIPTEALYISHGVGFVVSASVFETDNFNPFYRENLYWFDRTGVIMGIHPMIGKGPHSFTAIPLYADRERACKMDATEVMDRRGRRWHLYFADGFGALCCIRFDVEDPALF